MDVLNGTGTTGLAATVAELMTGQGFAVGEVGNEPGTVNETVVNQAMADGACLPGSDAIIAGPDFTTWLAQQA